MPKREDITEKIRPYHIVSRAVDQKEVFALNEDRARFLFQMHAANVGKPALNLHRKDISKALDSLLEGQEISKDFLVQNHDPLVHIFSFAVFGDHYHLGLVPKQKEGIARYMQKLNLAFAKYYNLKHKRSGALFEGRFRLSPIQTPAQLRAVVWYMNIKHPKDILYEGAYKYSSFPDLFEDRKSLLISQESRENLNKLLGDSFLAQASKLELKDLLEDKAIPIDKLFLD